MRIIDPGVPVPSDLLRDRQSSKLDSPSFGFQSGTSSRNHRTRTLADM